jgi:protein involved in polysaccharide export with SLBB domain
MSKLVYLLLVFGLCQTPMLWAAEGSSADDYRLASGDEIRVTVFGHEDLSGEFEVNSTGDVSLPLIREVQAEGATVSELEERIIDALKPDYLIHPRVSVEILNYRPFYIVGEVNTPGSYPYVNGMTVLNAVAVSGGFTYRARKNRVSIKRANGGRTVELQAELTSQVHPGDVIEVSERFF